MHLTGGMVDAVGEKVVGVYAGSMELLPLCIAIANLNAVFGCNFACCIHELIHNTGGLVDAAVFGNACNNLGSAGIYLCADHIRGHEDGFDAFFVELFEDIVKCCGVSIKGTAAVVESKTDNNEVGIVAEHVALKTCIAVGSISAAYAGIDDVDGHVGIEVVENSGNVVVIGRILVVEFMGFSAGKAAMGNAVAKKSYCNIGLVPNVFGGSRKSFSYFHF